MTQVFEEVIEDPADSGRPCGAIFRKRRLLEALDRRNSSRLPEFRISCTVVRVLTVAPDIEVLARFGRALADPIRCRILLALRDAPAYPADLADALGVSRTRLSNHLACLRDCGLVITVPDGRRTRYELADERLGHALDDLRTAVVAVETDRTCPDAFEKGCC
jgi:DNA-binding transcriptional ArsR family regulator